MDQPRPRDPQHPAASDVAADGSYPDGPDEALDLEALRRKVASLPLIEQAKGMLMGYYGIDAERAFALLRRWSSRRHVKLRELCREIVDAGAEPGTEPYAGLRAALDRTDGSSGAPG